MYTTWSSSDNIPLYLQTTTIAQKLSIDRKGKTKYESSSVPI